jgi:hypothetical protein
LTSTADPESAPHPLRMERQETVQIRLHIRALDSEDPIDAAVEQIREEHVRRWLERRTRIHAPGETPLADITNLATHDLGSRALLEGPESYLPVISILFFAGQASKRNQSLRARRDGRAATELMDPVHRTMDRRRDRGSRSDEFNAAASPVPPASSRLSAIDSVWRWLSRNDGWRVRHFRMADRSRRLLTCASP